jgi:hypothetical protein
MNKRLTNRGATAGLAAVLLLGLTAAPAQGLPAPAEQAAPSTLTGSNPRATTCRRWAATSAISTIPG